MKLDFEITYQRLASVPADRVDFPPAFKDRRLGGKHYVVLFFGTNFTGFGWGIEWFSTIYDPPTHRIRFMLAVQLPNVFT